MTAIIGRVYSRPLAICIIDIAIAGIAVRLGLARNCVSGLSNPSCAPVVRSQVRRGLHRLQDALALVEKNTLGLQTNCASVAEEVDEIYRRLSKALKDRTEHLRNEVDRYLGTELRGLIQLKENLELEIANIQSNCDLAEAHINENVPWDDAELLDTKELFLRTVEFIRFAHPVISLFFPTPAR